MNKLKIKSWLMPVASCVLALVLWIWFPPWVQAQQLPPATKAVVCVQDCAAEAGGIRVVYTMSFNNGATAQSDVVVAYSASAVQIKQALQNAVIGHGPAFNANSLGQVDVTVFGGPS